MLTVEQVVCGKYFASDWYPEENQWMPVECIRPAGHEQPCRGTEEEEVEMTSVETVNEDPCGNFALEGAHTFKCPLWTDPHTETCSACNDAMHTDEHCDVCSCVGFGPA